MPQAQDTPESAADLATLAAAGRSLITVVGVCGSGKSELVRRLRERGFSARSVAQEHSYVPALWQHDAVPDVLVYLQALGRTVRRRGRLLHARELEEQRRRLTDARRNASLRVRTDALTPEQVEAIVLQHLAQRGIVAAAGQVCDSPDDSAAAG
jgi:hypothetical protein